MCSCVCQSDRRGWQSVGSCAGDVTGSCELWGVGIEPEFSGTKPVLDEPSLGPLLSFSAVVQGWLAAFELGVAFFFFFFL